MLEPTIVQRIAEQAAITPEAVKTVVKLFQEGATIPFIARYRKDLTGNLDEAKLETIAERNSYYMSLLNRRTSILENIAKEGKLAEDLRSRIEDCFDKTKLEDLYLPYRQKRRTRASVARDQGLEPLANFLWAQVPGDQDINQCAVAFVRPEKVVGSVEQALEGARRILAERIVMDPEVRTMVRDRMLKEGGIASFSTKNAQEKKTKFETYYNFSESVATIPSHRFLAILRGVKEGYLRMELSFDDQRMFSELLASYLKGQEFLYCVLTT